MLTPTARAVKQSLEGRVSIRALSHKVVFRVMQRGLGECHAHGAERWRARKIEATRELRCSDQRGKCSPRSLGAAVALPPRHVRSLSSIRRKIQCARSEREKHDASQRPVYFFWCRAMTRDAAAISRENASRGARNGDSLNDTSVK